jgi:hypothetical protein
MTVNRERGWRRIGIVLSVIWFIGFAAYLLVSEGTRISEGFRLHLELCSLAMDRDTERLQYIATQEERAAKQAENWAKSKDCRDGASKHYQLSTDVPGRVQFATSHNQEI